MKRYWIGAIVMACAFALAALMGCDTTLGHSGNDTPPALASVRSVTQDPVNDCTIVRLKECMSIPARIIPAITMSLPAASGGVSCKRSIIYEARSEEEII